jgi:hypothetical protein
MRKIAYGVLTLKGVERVDITGMEDVTMESQVFFRALGILSGAIVRSEITVGIGFGVSSTHADDTCEVAWEVWD